MISTHHTLSRYALGVMAFAALGLAVCAIIIAREVRSMSTVGYVVALLIATLFAVCGVVFLL